MNLWFSEIVLLHIQSTSVVFYRNFTGRIKTGYETNMPSMYEKLLQVIVKSPDARTEYECQDLVPWFRNKSVVFETLTPECIADIIRHCEFKRCQNDEVIIKQGENGHRLFIILKGQVSIHVIQDKENSQEILQNVERICSKSILDRNDLGQKVWTSGEGKTVGEVALLKDDCIRTASVVCDCETDLIMIERNLYNRSVKDVFEREYQEKIAFVERNSLFSHWPARHKKALVISLQKQNLKYSTPITKQGQPADCMFFILSGEIEITCDQAVFDVQYDSLWRQMQKLVPGLLPKPKDRTFTPHESMTRRVKHKASQMCLLGENELCGALEIILGLNSYIENALVTREAGVLVLSKENYQRFFTKKFAQKAVEVLRERLTMRLYLYIHRSEGSETGSPFLKFLTYMLQDSEALNQLKRMKRKEKEVKAGIVSQSDIDSADARSRARDAKEMAVMMKKLGVKPSVTYEHGPWNEASQKVLEQIEKGYMSYIERSRGTESPKGYTASKASRSFMPRNLLSPDDDSFAARRGSSA